MKALLDRVRTAIAEQKRSLIGAARSPSLRCDDKLEAIESYASFCAGREFPAYPLEMFLEISNICDLKCAMCVQFSALNAHRFKQLRSAERGFLDDKGLSDNLARALKRALLVHCFGYGEPTIHPAFRTMVDEISRYEVLIDFFTNGMHLDPELCAFLVDRKVSVITISFSGATKETYENIYIGGNFERVLGGMKALAAAKKARNATYPIIEVNSLGFRDHVDAFEKFVALMAEHGANTVYLKKLQHHKDVPQLYEHVSVMRPGREGVIVKRAVALGRRLGVEVNADMYTRHGAVDDADYERQQALLRQAAERHLQGGGRPFGGNAVGAFQEIAKDVAVVRDPEPKKPVRVLALDADKVAARMALQVEASAAKREGAPLFHCMEPFKTMYVTRNGPTKPCCFANTRGVYLGDVDGADALDVWRGAGFGATREAIAVGDYPMNGCAACLKNRSA